MELILDQDLSREDYCLFLASRTKDAKSKLGVGEALNCGVEKAFLQCTEEEAPSFPEGPLHLWPCSLPFSQWR